MRPVGFSTGALARGRYDEALRMLAGKPVCAVELSALRWAELAPLLGGLEALDLGAYSYVSVHAPSRFDEAQERELCGLLAPLARRGMPIVLHPDAAHELHRWSELGENLLIENMDGRKRWGQTAAELGEIFGVLPRAGLCFDIGHALQVDPTMAGGREILVRFGDRLRQLHVSEVGADCRHLPLSDRAIAAFRLVAPLVPEHVPLILETPVGEPEIAQEVARALSALPAGAGPRDGPPGAC